MLDAEVQKVWLPCFWGPLYSRGCRHLLNDCENRCHLRPCKHLVVVVQSLSHVWLFATPWTAARQASLSFTVSQSVLKLMSIKSVMPSNHLILCHPLLLPSVFPSIRVVPTELLFTAGGQSIGASASVLPMNIQYWFPLGLTGLIFLLSKGLSRVVFSSTTMQKHQYFSAQLSL